MAYVIGVDCGTSGTKTVLFREDGTVMASATIEYPMYQPKNGYDRIDAEQTGEIFAYAEGIKQFLNAARTEREAVKEAIRMAEAEGFVPYTFGMELQPGSKVYVNNRGKALMLAVLGQQPLDHGCVIAGAHIDSPRLDLKQTPMYEDSELAYFKTHYYGGIKKYKWVTIPLELHGTGARKDGSTVDIAIGREPDEPQFVITAQLPHLGKDQMRNTMEEGITGEALNIVIGSMPYAGEGRDRVKLAVLSLLHDEYGISGIQSQMYLVYGGFRAFQCFVLATGESAAAIVVGKRTLIE